MFVDGSSPREARSCVDVSPLVVLGGGVPFFLLLCVEAAAFLLFVKGGDTFPADPDRRQGQRTKVRFYNKASAHTRELVLCISIVVRNDLVLKCWE
jgi:hypothetical protein